MDYMHHRQSSPGPRPASPRRSMQRQRSNSFPIIEALGCTTPEARLILAESRAAVRKRRRRRNQSVEEATRAFNPREALPLTPRRRLSGRSLPAARGALASACLISAHARTHTHTNTHARHYSQRHGR
ncbi:uncharacterized protein SETTUDRAFT_36130 [Exserohilum turcica Et28A]|uniref:Uncharacterized protein n=1 Tax=Exserohilum turcicum (strain 28A) TaxID=671987 RepID=R0J1H2_EXST2|nr:uncharacterized protein SETTUDRAFT_36130 [Exserohilum turcica Et28A]EOA90611.1 hypothetical protein SETTUDRAFT_36130 [Exserohilum turcica Et28A]